jgi:hypothetical protein
MYRNALKSLVIPSYISRACSIHGDKCMTSLVEKSKRNGPLDGHTHRWINTSEYMLNKYGVQAVDVIWMKLS